MKKLALFLFISLSLLQAEPVTFQELGLVYPVKLPYKSSTICLPLKEISGAHPKSLILNFKQVESRFLLDAFLGEEKLISQEISSDTKVQINLPQNAPSRWMVHLVVTPIEEEKIRAWIAPDSEVEYSAEHSNPLKEIRSGLKENGLPLFLETSTKEGYEALLKAASQVGATYIPWRIKPQWTTERTSPQISIGSFEKEIEVIGSDIKVDLKAVDKLYEFLVDVKPTDKKVITLKELGFETRALGPAWQILIPFTFSEASDYSGRLRWLLKVSNTSEQDQKILFSSGSERVRILTVPAGAKSYPLAFDIDTEYLPNHTFFKLSLLEGGEFLQIDASSTIERLSYDVRSTVFLSNASRTIFGKGEVILSELKVDHIQTAFQMVSFLAQAQRRPLDLSLREIQYADGERQGAWAVGVLAALDLSTFSPRVDVSWPFVTKSGFINSILFPKGKYISHSFMQIFDVKRPMIAITDLTGDYTPWTASDTWQEAFRFDAPFAQKEASSWVMIDYNIRFPPIYLDRFRLDIWWKNNKIWIVAFLTLATILTLRLVFKKLTYKHDI